MRAALPLLLLATVLLATGCNGGGDDGGEEDPPASQEVSYDEGTIRMEIETLDTGLLKGHSYVDAAEGWSVGDVSVTAVTTEERDWGVIEIDEEGDVDSVTFFEIQVGELPRGQQVVVTTTAFFTDSGGLTSERSVEDQWPP
jgi:hypothetical protein